VVVRGFLSFLIDALAPPICVHCGTEIAEGPSLEGLSLPAGFPREILSDPDRADGILCLDCLLRLEPADAAGTPGAAERVGPGIVTPFFTNGVLLSLVRFLKFEGGASAARPMASWMALALRGRLPDAPALVTPVPLHGRRRRKRGYNQASLLAELLAERLGLPFDDRVLTRWRHTRSQARLDATERDRNVRGAFRLVAEGPVRGRHILLVDDLVTSGGTIRACVETFLPAGPAGVTAVAAGRRKAEYYNDISNLQVGLPESGRATEGPGRRRAREAGSP